MLLFGFILMINVDRGFWLLITKKFGNIHPIISVIGVIIGMILLKNQDPYLGDCCQFVLMVKICERGMPTSE